MYSPGVPNPSPQLKTLSPDMWIEFLKPRQGLGYFAGDKANLEKEAADELINEGYAKQVEKPATVSDLPADLPGRTILITAGLTTKAEVLASSEALTDIKGIGEKMKEEIIKMLEND